MKKTGLRLPYHPHTNGTRPHMGEALRKKWADPEWRAALLAKRAARMAELKGTGYLGTGGTPPGMRKPEFKKIMTQCRRKAYKVHRKMVEAGIVVSLDKCEKITTAEGHKVEVPTTEAEMASRALREAMVIALAPYELKSKLTAIRAVLDFTKAKPAQKIDAKFSNAEAWLDEVAAEVISGKAE